MDRWRHRVVFLLFCNYVFNFQQHCGSGWPSAVHLFYPGGKGPFIGATLGVVGVRAAEEEVAGLGPLDTCREPAAAAVPAAVPAAPSSSG